MRDKLILALMILYAPTMLSQRSLEFTWRYYTPGNTGIQGDYTEAVWIDHDGDPYIAGYTPGWEEGGFAKFIQTENRWVNYSNVDYPVIGNINDVGSSRISDIVEDTSGVLWMATWRGLLKFDPSVGPGSFEFWGADNSAHPGGRTRDIAIAPDGTIWGAVISVTWGNGGLFQFNPASGQMQVWGYGSTANNWPSLIHYTERVSIQNKPGVGYIVWIDGVGDGNLITFDSQTQLFTLHPFNYDPGDYRALPGSDCVDEDNNFWVLRFVATGNFYSLDYRTPDGSWVVPQQPESNSENTVWSFKAYGNGKALLVDGNSVVWQFNGTSWQSLGAWSDGGFSYGIDIDGDGNIWTSGVGGAAKRDVQTGNWQRFRITNSSQISYWVEDITIDNEGIVWMAGNAGPGAGGFLMFDGIRWINYNNLNYGIGFPFPFPTDNVEVIYSRPSNGDIIINPMYSYLHSWNGTSYSSLNYPHDRSEGVVEDSWGRLWSLGEYYNLKYYSNNNWTPVSFDGWGYSICKDPTLPGTIWASSGNQVLQTDGTQLFTRYNTDFPELDPQSDLFTTVIADNGGITWLGSNKGLFRLNAINGTYEFFSPQNSQIPGENISPLIVSPDGLLWFSNFWSSTTSEYGLCWYDGTNFGMIPQEQTGGLPHAQIYDIEAKEVGDGYELWISCASRGIAVMHVVTNPVGADLDITENKQPRIQIYPNPFSSYTNILVSMPVDGFTEINIYDINGRLIRNLARGYIHQDGAKIIWDRTDNQGSMVPPGVYAVRLKSAHFSKSSMVIVK